MRTIIKLAIDMMLKEFKRSALSIYEVLEIADHGTAPVWNVYLMSVSMSYVVLFEHQRIVCLQPTPPEHT